MGNPDLPTPQHIVDKLVEAVQESKTTATSPRAAFPAARRDGRGIRERFSVELDPETEVDRHHRLQGRAGHLALAVTPARRHRPGAEPELPDPLLRLVIAAAPRSAPLPSGRGSFFARLERGGEARVPKPLAVLLVPVTTRRPRCVDLRLLRQGRGLRARARLWSSTISPTPTSISTATAALVPGDPGRREVAVEFFSMSKSYYMPGWRMGFASGNKR